MQKRALAVITLAFVLAIGMTTLAQQRTGPPDDLGLLAPPPSDLLAPPRRDDFIEAGNYFINRSHIDYAHSMKAGGEVRVYIRGRDSYILLRDDAAEEFISAIRPSASGGEPER